MKKKIAFIIGIGGQDGFLMGELLARKNYKVFGFYKSNLKKKNKKITYIKKNLNKVEIINKLIVKYKPTEIYNFASISSIFESENNILENEQVNNQSVLKIFLRLINIKRKIKFFQALSSEIFKKKLKINRINEFSEFDAKNPYAITKLNLYLYLRYFRKKYNMKFYSAFLFNHNSFYSEEKFFPKKICKELAMIKQNKKKIIKIKNIDSKRDWSAAEDTIKNIWCIVQKKPDDFVLGSEKLYSVKNFIDVAASNFNLDLIWKKKRSNFYAIDKKSKKKIIKVEKSSNIKKNQKFSYANCSKFKKKIGKIYKTNFTIFVKNLCIKEINSFQ